MTKQCLNYCSFVASSGQVVSITHPLSSILFWLLWIVLLYKNFIISEMMWCYPQNNLQGFRLGCIKFVGKDEKTPSWQHRAFLWIWTVSQSPWFLGGRFCFIFPHKALKNVLLDLHLIICFWIRYRCFVLFSNSSCLLFIYRRVNEFCLLILYLIIGQNCLADPKSFCQFFEVSYVYIIMSCGTKVV